MVRQPDLPDGSVVNGQIIITSYFDSEGVMKYCVGVDGDLNIAQALGLLDLGKLSVYRLFQKNNPDEEEFEETEDQEDYEDDDE